MDDFFRSEKNVHFFTFDSIQFPKRVPVYSSLYDRFQSETPDLKGHDTKKVDVVHLRTGNSLCNSFPGTGR